MCRSDAGAAMPSNTLTARGRFFEEFTAGQRYTTPGRTVTESDIVAFAGLTGDFNSIHTDAVYAKASSFGERVAHGMLGISFSVGLAVRAGILEGTVLGFREIKEWKFTQPIHIGDTIHVEIEVAETKAFPRLGGGVVTLGLKMAHHEAVPAMTSALGG